MRLPPLNALRAFEAAARHQGFIDAASELHVTRGAISRQVKLLEDHLGVPLFHRTSRGVTLTRAGHDLLPVLSDAFRRIRDGAARVVDRTELRIICPPALSIRWLLPRLPDFRTKHPDIRLKLTTDFHGDHAFDGTDYDIGISCEVHPEGRHQNVQTRPLVPYTLIPACAPSFLERTPLNSPRDMAGATRVVENVTGSDWPDWLDHFGLADLEFGEVDAYPNFDLAIKAASMGTGVIMGDHLLCAEEFRTGVLVAPFPDMICPSRWGWYSVLYPAALSDTPNGATFLDWLSETAENDRRDLFAGTPYA